MVFPSFFLVLFTEIYNFPFLFIYFSPSLCVSFKIPLHLFPRLILCLSFWLLAHCCCWSLKSFFSYVCRPKQKQKSYGFCCYFHFRLFIFISQCYSLLLLCEPFLSWILEEFVFFFFLAIWVESSGYTNTCFSLSFATAENLVVVFFFYYKN